ncbi:MAG: DUF4263 domain-containing protein, partial [Erysipelotrichaceae bacterium]|nr:DUF4263 domain-containing protein [Erysipelotrichaceae bacterium]
IKATVYEDNRQIKVLTIQDYTPITDNPHKNGHSFIGNEINKLYSLIKDTQTIKFDSEKYRVLSDDDIEHLNLNDQQAIKIVSNNPELFAKIAESNIKTQDIVAYAYRKEQLKVFEQLLNDSRENKAVSELRWQKFFENNKWIFGYGLGFVFLSGLDDKKLEQVIQGHDIAHYGKRADGVMKTRGVISNLCFVEIKKPNTDLLKRQEYRPGTYSASDELAGAVSQAQITCESALKSLNDTIRFYDNSGNPTGEEVFNIKPKSYLVIGDLSQFNTPNGINLDKYRSFELFRKNMMSPEIITYDELYERAKYIVESSK